MSRWGSEPSLSPQDESEECRSQVEDPRNSSSSISSLPAPRDRLFFVYGIFLLHGVGMLMSWNMFITIAPQYYVDYWFTDANGTKTSYADSFMSVLGVTSQIPNVGIMFFNAAIVIAGSLMLRIVVPLIINCLLVALIIIFVIFVHPNGDNIQWFYIVTLVIIMLMNLCNGIYQSSIYGICADFPDTYINSLVIGNNLCGVFTSLMSILTTLISPDDIELNALLYFSISLAILLCCLFSLRILVKLPFYKHYKKVGEKAREEDDAESLSLRQYWDCFTYCWVQLFNNFFVYFVSLCIFPAMLTDTPYRVQKCPDGVSTTSIPGGCGEWNSIWPENLYFAINTFLNFNVFAFAGSTLANYVQWPKPRFLWIPVVLRVLFIPFFMYCNYLPEYTQGGRSHAPFFTNEWWPTTGCAVLALTCGYFSSLALMYTPSGVPSSYQKISGMAASIFLMLGILAGVSFTPVISAMVKAWL